MSTTAAPASGLRLIDDRFLVPRFRALLVQRFEMEIMGIQYGRFGQARSALASLSL